MATTYAFQVSLPVTDLLPRNRCVNRFHMEHVAGGLVDTDLEDMCEAIAGLYQTKYGATNKEIDVRAYDTDAVPNYPRAQVVVAQGTPWLIHTPREIALVLSYSGPNRGNKSERGRIYLMPQLNALQSGITERPDNGQLTWALDWYKKANESFPDLGGVDWKFGVWSKTYKKFRQTTQAWCNDDWDVQRRRGLREAGRLSVTRDG
jgi:hypothetical protein